MTDTTTQSKGKKILIIDDDKFLLDMYMLKFKEKGFEVYTALLAQDGLSTLESKTFEPDLILVDLVMPGIDGFEFLRLIQEKKLASRCRIAVLSNLGESSDVERAKTLGASDYIIKANNTPTEVVAQAIKLLSSSSSR